MNAIKREIKGCNKCSKCEGSGDVYYGHPNDPYVKIFRCEECRGRGWVPEDAEIVEIVPGHQSACFAGERQEKRGLK